MVRDQTTTNLFYFTYNLIHKYTDEDDRRVQLHTKQTYIIYTFRMHTNFQTILIYFVINIWRFFKMFQLHLHLKYQLNWCRRDNKLRRLFVFNKLFDSRFNIKLSGELIVKYYDTTQVTHHIDCGRAATQKRELINVAHFWPNTLTTIYSKSFIFKHVLKYFHFISTIS